MGLISSRLNLDHFGPARARASDQESCGGQVYLLNKDYFSNYFLMGGERFEINDPDYIFGDICDLNFLSRTKPFPLPYKQAQQNLLGALNVKQKTNTKVSARISRIPYAFERITGTRTTTAINRPSSELHSSNRRQVAKTHSSSSSSSICVASNGNNKDPFRPLVMLINIRKETVRLVKCATTGCNVDIDLNSITDSVSCDELKSDRYAGASSLSKDSKQHLSRSQLSERQQLPGSHEGRSHQVSSYSSSIDHLEHHASTRDQAPNETREEYPRLQTRGTEPDGSSLLSTTSSAKSCYRSVKNSAHKPTPSPTHPSDSSEVDDEDFKDALDDTSFSRTTNPTTMATATNSTTNGISNNPMRTQTFINKIYNIEFTFDAEVDCYIRVFYFCTKEVNSTGINYKPQHATYKSKVYYYKKGLNQKFEQPEHTFQPYLFDENLLIYKPIDLGGNYNSGAVFPIVIHCVALEGSSPRQSQSLVATIEKMDDSYAIKPLKQLIFVDGIQYILQDIFGIENKQLIKPPSVEALHDKKRQEVKNRASYKKASGLREKSYSLQSNLDAHHHHHPHLTTSTRPDDLDSVDKGSLASIETSSCFKMSATNSITKLHLQRSSDNSFECVVCLAEERDTMLLPCRHLCLCGSCAQSLRYQASTCPICRCPFKAALNLRTIQGKKKSSVTSSSVTAIASTTFSKVSPDAQHNQHRDRDCKTATTRLAANKKDCKQSPSTELKAATPSSSSSFISLNLAEDQRSKTTSFTTTTTSPAPTG